MTELILGDCLDIIPTIPNKSIDLIIADLPYGKTQNSWDKVINPKKMWKEFNRVIKDNGAILCFAEPPFNIHLAASNLKMYRYDWVWEKTTVAGFLNCGHSPMKAHEYILVFYKKLPVYNPQMTQGHKKEVSKASREKCIDSANYGKHYYRTAYSSTERYPRSVLKFKSDKQFSQEHSTQKPIELIKYLIKTYSNPGARILDPTAGSGTTGVANEQLGDRDCILIEKYTHNIAKKRLDEARGNVGLFKEADALKQPSFKLLFDDLIIKEKSLEETVDTIMDRK